jgi:protein involved in polysaccharide export with SLBB domain
MFRPSRQHLAIAAALISVGALVGACGGAGDLGGGQVYQVAPAPGGIARAYRLGVGDKLKIQVFGEPDLSGAFEVSAGGTVALPLVGEIPAHGRSVSELRDAMVQRLSQGYLKNPRVTVDVTNYRPIYIHGEVRSGGEFAFKNGLKLRDAVALAGGYTYRANQAYILLTRQGVAQGAKVANSADLEVLPGDNIQIPERFF